MGKAVKTYIYPRTTEECIPIYSQVLPLGNYRYNYKQMVLHSFSVGKILLFTIPVMLAHLWPSREPNAYPMAVPSKKNIFWNQVFKHISSCTGVLMSLCPELALLIIGIDICPKSYKQVVTHIPLTARSIIFRR